jgi:hypothetical protein
MGLARLTHKQESFAQRVAEGAKLSTAYKQAYNASGMAPTTVWPHASRLARHPMIAARVNALQAEKEAVQRMCAVGRTDRLIAQLEYLSDHGSSDAVKIRALELLGKTCGMFKPQPEPVPTRSPEEIQTALIDRLSAKMINELAAAFANPRATKD